MKRGAWSSHEVLFLVVALLLVAAPVTADAGLNGLQRADLPSDGCPGGVDP